MYEAGPFLHVYGRPLVGTPIAANLTGPAGAPYLVYYSPGTASLQIPLLQGTVLIDPTTAVLATTGTLPPRGLAVDLLLPPDDPGLVGQTVHLQGVVASGGSLVLTGRASVTFE